MCDLSYDHLHWDHDEPIPASKLIRPETPTPHRSRMLQRTESYASINSVDTIRSPKKNKGVRRRIDEIAENLKKKDTKKKPNTPSREDSNGAGHDSRSKTSRRPWKRTKAVQIVLRRPGENSDPALPDRLYSSGSSSEDTSTLIECKSESPADVPPPNEETQDGFLFPAVTIERSQSIPKADIKDIHLKFLPLESDVTIWDGLQASHHLYKCRIFLQCVGQPYDSVSIPDIRLFEMDCTTHPVTGSPYARQPVLQATYQGATPNWLRTTDKVKLADGIHVDKLWRTVLEDDDAWGWYRDACVPLSPRLFDKADYREFQLVGRVWIENECVKGESTFGISMLLRGVDMPK